MKPIANRCVQYVHGVFQRSWTMARSSLKIILQLLDLQIFATKQEFLCVTHEVNFRLHVLGYQNFSPHVPLELYLSSFFITSHVKLHVLVRQRHLQLMTLISICNLRLTDNWLYCFLTQYHVNRSDWFLHRKFRNNWGKIGNAVNYICEGQVKGNDPGHVDDLNFQKYLSFYYQDRS